MIRRAYSLRRNRKRGRRAAASSPVVDLTVHSDSDDGDDNDDNDDDDDDDDDDDGDVNDVPNNDRHAVEPRLVPLEDGRVQSISPPLVASLTDTSTSGNKSKEVKVTVKWSAIEDRERGVAENASDSRTKDAGGSREDVEDLTFRINEKIFAWDGGHLYDAKVMKRKLSDDGFGFRYLVHYAGYERSHDEWLAARDMLKDAPSSREFYEERARGIGVGSAGADRSGKDAASETFCVDERIYALDRGVLYEARVTRIKDDPDDGRRRSRRYRVHYSGYKRSHDRWLTPGDMRKMTPSNREVFRRSRGLPSSEDDRDDREGNVPISRAPNETADAKSGRNAKGTRRENVRPRAAAPNERRAPARDEGGKGSARRRREDGKEGGGDGRERPEAVASGGGRAAPAYDEDDYESLRRRYLVPRVRERAELAGGITLRRQVRDRVIDKKTRGFRMLRSRVDALLRRGRHGEVYGLLCQLREHELDPRRTPAIFRDGGDADVEEVLDLTKENDGRGGSGVDCVDVDGSIADVLLAGARGGSADRKPSPTPSGGSPDFASSRRQVGRASDDGRATNDRTVAQSRRARERSKSASGGEDRREETAAVDRTVAGFERARERSESPSDCDDLREGIDKLPASAFDEDDDESLRRRYLCPRVRGRRELAGGMTLRRRVRDRVIDGKTRGFRMLRSRVDALLRRGDHAEAYGLLRRLRSWELDPRRTPVVFRDGGDGDVAAVLDLTNEDEVGKAYSEECMDVDEFITNVLLAGVGGEGDQRASPSPTSGSAPPDCAPSGRRAGTRVSDDGPAKKCQAYAESTSDSDALPDIVPSTRRVRQISDDGPAAVNVTVAELQHAEERSESPSGRDVRRERAARRIAFSQSGRDAARDGNGDRSTAKESTTGGDDGGREGAAARADRRPSEEGRAPEFDEDDCESPRRTHPAARARGRAELAGGTSPRGRVGDGVVDEKAKGFRMSRTGADSLLRRDDHPNHGEVYGLLRRLRNFETDPKRAPAVVQGGGNDCVAKALDPTKEGDGRVGSDIDCIGEDEYITDVLLMGVKEKGCDRTSISPSGELTNVPRSSRQVYRVSVDGPVSVDGTSREFPSDSDGCHRDRVAHDDVRTEHGSIIQSPSSIDEDVTPETHLVRITGAAIEEFETYSYLVIETVSQGAQFLSLVGPDNVSYDDDGDINAESSIAPRSTSTTDEASIRPGIDFATETVRWGTDFCCRSSHATCNESVDIRSSTSIQATSKNDETASPPRETSTADGNVIHKTVPKRLWLSANTPCGEAPNRQPSTCDGNSMNALSSTPPDATPGSHPRGAPKRRRSPANASLGTLEFRPSSAGKSGSQSSGAVGEAFESDGTRLRRKGVPKRPDQRTVDECRGFYVLANPTERQNANTSARPPVPARPLPIAPRDVPELPPSSTDKPGPRNFGATEESDGTGGARLRLGDVCKTPGQRTADVLRDHNFKAETIGQTTTCDGDTENMSSPISPHRTSTADESVQLSPSDASHVAPELRPSSTDKSRSHSSGAMGELEGKQLQRENMAEPPGRLMVDDCRDYYVESERARLAFDGNDNGVNAGSSSSFRAAPASHTRIVSGEVWSPPAALSDAPKLLPSSTNKSGSQSSNVSGKPCATSIKELQLPTDDGIFNNDDHGNWMCACGNEMPSAKSRCGRCHHWRGGKRPKKKALPASWKCGSCDASNAGPKRKCGLCLKLRRGNKSSAVSTRGRICSGGVRYGNAKHPRGLAARTEQSTDSKPSKRLTGAVGIRPKKKAPSASWKCGYCDASNAGSKRKCGGCREWRSGNKSSAVATGGKVCSGEVRYGNAKHPDGFAARTERSIASKPRKRLVGASRISNVPQSALGAFRELEKSDGKQLRWDDIPKPPGQRTFEECRGFYVEADSMAWCRGGSCDESIHSATPNQPLGPSLFGQIGSHAPPQHHGSEEQHNQLENTFGQGAFVRHPSLSPPMFNGMSLQKSGMPPPQALDRKNQSPINQTVHQEDYNFASTRLRMIHWDELYIPPADRPKDMSQQNHLVASPAINRRLQLLDPQPHHHSFPQKVEASTFDSIPAPDMRHSSPTNKKSSIAKVVTPEVHLVANILSTLATSPKKKFQKRAQNRKLDRKPKRKLHFPPDIKCRRFSVTDFGFCRDPVLKLFSSTVPESEEDPHRRNSTKPNSAKRCHRSKHFKPTIAMPTFPIIPQLRVDGSGNGSSNCTARSLQEDWNKQCSRRKNGEWIPNGHLTGRWKPPDWVDLNKVSCNTKHKKYPSCRKSLLPILEGLLSNFMVGMDLKRDTINLVKKSCSLQDIVCPQYLTPSIDLLRNAHSAVRNLLPAGDCEDWEVVELARRYYDHWRPKETKVILLAESHAFTPKDRALRGPGLDENMLQDTYFGPRGFISLVYCLGYGENDALKGKARDKSNKGTPQFWTLFAACSSRGVGHVATTNSKKTFSSPFAADLLKGGELPVEERLKAKLDVLEDLRDRGIWLLDASVFGWYMSQPQEYSRSPISNEVHRRTKTRPPKDLKTPSLVLSWELFTKHVIREVAEEGNLKLLVPIGMEVEAALTRERMEDAIGGGQSAEARVTDIFPAPNAWIPGGYGPFHAKLAALVNEAAPRIDTGAKTEEVPKVFEDGIGAVVIPRDKLGFKSEEFLKDEACFKLEGFPRDKTGLKSEDFPRDAAGLTYEDFPRDEVGVKPEVIPKV